MLDLGAEIAFLLGLVVYAEVFSGLSYRSIYYALQSLLVLVNLLDLFWVRVRVRVRVRVSQPARPLLG